MESADVNNDGAVNVSDPLSLLGYLFLGRPQPTFPGPPALPCAPEPDPRDALFGLGCAAYRNCR
jgi:hypothetical protein